MNMNFLLYLFLNTTFVVLVSPLFMSLIKKAKAYAQGRQGPPLLQTYYLLAKLLKKETVYSSNASLIMRIAPPVNLAFMLAASLSVPLLFVPDKVAGIGNVVLFLYLLVVAKFFMALGGLDAGSTFGGMGSSREMTFSAVVEPVTLLVFGALAFVLKTTELDQMFLRALDTSILENPTLLLISISLFIILIVETARIPIDNPETHLELTMIHEAMVLEQSGPNLAMMETAHAIKQTLLMAVLINILVPWGLATSPTPLTVLGGAASFLAKSLALAAGIGLFESSLAKLRLFRLPALFMLSFFFAFLTVVLELLP